MILLTHYHISDLQGRMLNLYFAVMAEPTFIVVQLMPYRFKLSRKTTDGADSNERT